MKTIKNLLAIGLLTALAGCSATLGSKPGELYTQDKTKSVAWNVAAFAGYPGMFSDHRYTETIGDGVSMASNAIVLKDGIPSLSPVGAASLGIGSGILKSLTAYSPLNRSKITMVALEPSETYTSVSAIKRMALQQFKIRPEKAIEPTEELRSFIKTADISTLVCSDYSSVMDSVGFTNQCYIPTNPDFNLLIKIVRPATGSEFAGVWNLPVGSYSLMLVSSGPGSAFIPKTWDSMFHLSPNGAVMIYGTDTLLPFAAPRDDGKRLIVKGGKGEYL